MSKDSQDRIDAYLRGEMDTDSRIQFEKDLESNSTLNTKYLQTKAIVDAIVDRKKKLDIMAQWDKEEKNRLNIRRWTIGVSAAACIALGFFAIRPMLMTTTSAPGSNFTMPNFGSEVYYRGGDSSMEFLDSLITVKDYERALACADSLIQEYINELKLNDLKDSLTEKEEYNKEVCEQELEELEWRKANLLVALEKTMEARECLKRIVAGEGLYMLQAQMLLNRLNLK